jgi:hypothetical protein
VNFSSRPTGSAYLVRVKNKIHTFDGRARKDRISFAPNNMITVRMKLTADRREYSFGTSGGHGTFYFLRVFVIQVQALGLLNF